MKKLFKKHILVFLGLITCGLITAQTDYGIRVAGITVTSDNASNITGNGIKGKVTYDHATKTLTLSNTSIDAGDTNAIIFLASAKAPIYTINLVGNNTLTSTGSESATLYTEKTLVIKGAGTLTVTSPSDGDCGIYVNNVAALIIEECTVNTYGNWGIAGLPSGEKLIIINANVKAMGTRGSIKDLSGGISLIGSTISKPQGATVNFDAIKLNNTIVTDTIQIVPDGTNAKYYGIIIAGIAVSSKNADNISGYGISNGVSYNADNKTITLSNAKVNARISNPAIEFTPYASEAEYKINLVGNNSIIAEYRAALYTEKNVVISGAASTLNSISKYSCGMYAINGGSITIDGCTVNAAGDFGINGHIYGFNGEKLLIRNATVTAKGKYSSIADFDGGITLQNCYISEPAGAKLNSNNSAIVDASGNLITSQILIKPYNTGISDTQTDKYLTLYPNPAKDILTVNIGDHNKATTMAIIDIYGRTVMTHHINGTTVQINIGNLSAGIYSISVGNQKGTFIKN